MMTPLRTKLFPTQITDIFSVERQLKALWFSTAA